MMKRTLSLAAFALLGAAFAPSASAQSGDLAESVAKEGKAQVSQQQQYSSARRSGHMSTPRSSLNYGGADGTGRFDMSGHSVSGYFTVRDRSGTNFSSRFDPGRRRLPRSTYYSRAARSPARP
ncbi:hypothetical protein [Paludisphaera mucosa]|uniref:Uncharacterized protein n=1 Tax=Paludisphaera mucosa TaxID=3030827 RepID=A0ABT6F470_9BACT|nr:hypothetical protein [Paludisphaera mucosa]MDG3002312.1 hypothetical protein [Paludisphaera mucosa]